MTAATVAAWLLTYLLHSAVLLGMASLGCALLGSGRLATQEARPAGSAARGAGDRHAVARRRRRGGLPRPRHARRGSPACRRQPNRARHDRPPRADAGLSKRRPHRTPRRRSAVARAPGRPVGHRRGARRDPTRRRQPPAARPPRRPATTAPGSPGPAPRRRPRPQPAGPLEPVEAHRGAVRGGLHPPRGVRPRANPRRPLPPPARGPHRPRAGPPRTARPGLARREPGGRGCPLRPTPEPPRRPPPAAARRVPVRRRGGAYHRPSPRPRPLPGRGGPLGRRTSRRRSPPCRPEPASAGGWSA